MAAIPPSPAEPSREIPNPGFADDDGTTPEQVASALAAYVRDPRHGRYAVIAALQATRVLVPVVAILNEVEHNERGLAQDKSSDMATVLITAADGRTGMLAFSSMAAMQAWDSTARPVPTTLKTAAESGLQDGAAALVIDLAGPAQLALTVEEMNYLSGGLVLLRHDDGWAWAQLA